ncbi:hypothetical protein QE364_001463 [Nocardioides zeae]|uniref:Uncharacterized protein n=1 Tax=Nocardioides zeae TaxID=1457234 RepID=A0ACC6IG85_9ACTN|nr:DUF222 domain-containing protein [Nocardioides zeae]MDR6172753.1 hypothetical protein [Nocardioides zeae]MDR6209763.1 hypothetical protein [Nocardioides zeae]
MDRGTQHTTTALIDAVRERTHAARVAEAAAFVAVGDWAAAHTSDEVVGDPITVLGEWHYERDAEALAGDQFLELGGPGAPVVAEFCIGEVAAARGCSFDAARRLVGDAVELRYRLPRVHARIAAGEVDVWRGRRIAQTTRTLTFEGAGFVDRHVAYVAHKATGPEVDRLVAEAAARFDPETTEAERAEADGGRHLTIELGDVAYADPLSGTLRGTVDIHGTLDLADALDLERTVAHVARQLTDLGCDQDLDVRRSIALGEIARRCDGIATLEYDAASGPAGDETRPVQRARREVVLFVHLDHAAITGALNGFGPGIDACTGTTGIDLARLDTPGAPRGAVTVEQVQAWCAAPDTTVVVKPVIDLNEPDAVNSYTPPDRIADHVKARWPRCVFPYCTRSSRTADLDHCRAYDDNGPPGQTSTKNLFPLCRRHHRMKTHRELRTGRRWTYRPTHPDNGEPPNALIWTSPHGQTYLVDRDGTRPWPPPRPAPDPGPDET